MSTVKIKTESTAATVDDVKFKLEQHTSDIDTKVESDSEEGDIKSEIDDDTEDIDHFTITPKKQRQCRCEHPGCGRSYSSVSHLKMHQHEHRLQTELIVLGKTNILTRQSPNDRWSCPIPDCASTVITVSGLYKHIRRVHDSTIRQQQQQQQQQPSAVVARYNMYFHNMDDLYVNEVRCGYHNTIGVFICHECRLVPECLLTHLQQKHGFDEKSIDSSVLPENAVNASADPSINQHTKNPLLVSAISRPYQQHHQDINQGWLCVTSDCGYCGYAVGSKNYHKRNIHQGEQISTVPALVLRLAYSKSNSCYFFITRIDQASGAVTTSSSGVNQYKLDYSQYGLNTQDDGDGADLNETTDISNQRQWRCGYPHCSRLFNSTSRLGEHRREHSLDAEISVQSKTFTLSRQSLDDRWPCPVPNCESTCKTIAATRIHIRRAHRISLKHKHTNSESEDDQQQQTIKKNQRTAYYLNVDDFYIGNTRCGYHHTMRVFICHTCKLVPECLLIHLQQKHAYDEKSIDSAFLPNSAVNAGGEPSVNQHTNSSLLASAIRQPYQWHHPDIVQGWLCITSDCGYCGSNSEVRYLHHHKEHKGEQLSTVPALVVQLLYGKIKTSCFLIVRLDIATDSIDSNKECFDEDDGDELVLSDYSDEDEVH